ncbi:MULTISPECIES: ABC transporter ATP-binding protein [unclassified Streptococcus]|uniref:ABC transporter ATP-binding protein n=1 Tax=unclassified Streptococcus TaxID=2608887 RepID=UPI001071CFA7|nr:MULTISPECIES: ABC transporter ATP-binding protein [unclassified Streptococcus]MBF0786589.1 ABC transporter ATP-binding protein [Streptococcus sp. 19428wC2_LYSM12]MCQ9210918.1 ABC transporter ATP-binding protein [Streptococcus sp. B01]MCQ9214187.1 ABC transporter ATP-binding protein [Streptococcus sp. O1]TFV06552.1 ABC transporter ATP-binding protein [Streptococcus sp. LYSM12]
MTEKNIAVKIEHVSKFFRLPTEQTYSLRTAMVNRFKGIKGYREQHVLKDISFEVYKGDFFGILGRNGSGKSTLLKIISEIYVPEKGKVTIDGKLVSFIELGVGFNPELTGRENVYMNGAMLGFTTEEVDAMYDDIVEFAELKEFMNQKLKNYSSGMQVRLAFSVAIKAQGDILILDEVLAVGDEAFQRKCNDYFQERKKSGKTTILVTHDMGAVKKYCNRAVLIENGLVKSLGNPSDVANQYSLDNTVMSAPQAVVEEDPAAETQPVQLEVEHFSAKLLSRPHLMPEEEFEFEFSYELLKEQQTHIAMSFIDLDTNVGYYNDNSMDIEIKEIGAHTIRYRCSFPYFNQARLKLVATVRDNQKRILAFLPEEQAPVIFVERVKDDRLTESAKDAATGLLKRNGKWM